MYIPTRFLRVFLALLWPFCIFDAAGVASAFRPLRHVSHQRRIAVGSRFDSQSSTNRSPGSRSVVSLKQTPALGSGNERNPKSRGGFLSHRSKRIQRRDVVIVGSGLAGLSAALFLSQMDPDRHITVYEREDLQEPGEKTTTVASLAAAGMLAPQSERLPKGHLLDLCIESRRMFPDFCDLVESLAQECGPEGTAFLPPDSPEGGLKPWEIGFVASGGFLAPAFAGDSVATWAPPQDSGTATWLDATQVRELEPNLSPDVVGGWWFPEDASVDARRLTYSLRAACEAAGVQIHSGPRYEVTSLDLADGTCGGLWLKNGLYVSARSVLIANGAWMRNLLPVPVEPHKGQSLSLRMPQDRPPMLRRVLFAQDSYIVPKADGRIVVGATVEAGSFDSNVTPAGLLHILSHALELVPGLKDLPIEETWVGLRPTTPDKGPILGRTPWDNLFLAGGYWRNGVLLAPKTGQLLASLISGDELSEEDATLLDAFAWDRFTSKEGGRAMSANARYAASMHPIHTRKSGAGVAASVGTELGSYSSARSAREERMRDRNALFGGESMDDAFERAAALGRNDAGAYTFGEDDDEQDKSPQPPADADSEMTTLPTTPYEGTADAITVGTASDLALPVPSEAKGKTQTIAKTTKDDSSDLNSVYEAIRTRKAKSSVGLDHDDSSDDERPDPGFRIYHIDEETGRKRVVPPYTSPGEFLKSIKEEGGVEEDAPVSDLPTPNGGTSNEAYNGQTFDGYVEIQKANTRETRQEELAATRAARQQNRLGQEEIDMSKVGAQSSEQSDVPADKGGKPEQPDVAESHAPKDVPATPDLKAAYETIRANKAKQQPNLVRDDDEEERPDPGFRIYHIDETTGQQREVPPYTSPGDFLQMIQREKEDASTAATTTMEQPRLPDDTVQGQIQHANGSGGELHMDETTFDGYRDIQESNSRSSRQAELEAMRTARQQNRLESIDESLIGVRHDDDDDD